jgi:26S proteasome non-ATPase regulatory subunit 10
MDAAAEHARKGNLQYFSEGSPSEELQTLAAKKDEDGRSLLHSSAAGGNELLVDMFLQASPPEFLDAADDEGWTPLQACIH